MRIFFGKQIQPPYGEKFKKVTGGFTNDARPEASQAHAPVTIMDRDEFIELMLEYYERLEPEFQAKVPLRRVWLPAE